MKYMEFKEKLRSSGLSEEDFSVLTNTPMATIKGWAARRLNKTPKWVSPYLDLYAKNKQNEVVIKYLEGKLNGEG